MEAVKTQEINGEFQLKMEETKKSEDKLKEEEVKSEPLLEKNEDTVKIEINSDKDEEESTQPKKEKQTSKFIHPINEIKKAKEESSNVLEFLYRTVCIIFRTLGWYFFVGGLPFMSLIMLIVGSVYVHDCPIQPKIPYYLIVAGVFGTIQHFMAVWTKYTPKKDQPSFIRKALNIFDDIVQIFLFIWFIKGCIWVYSIYPPNYDDPGNENYCHRGLYLFTFWILIFSFVVLGIIIVICLIVFICCITSMIICATCVAKFDKDNKPYNKDNKESKEEENGSP